MDDSGNLMTDVKSVDRRWNNYFEGLFVSDDNLTSRTVDTNVDVYTRDGKSEKDNKR